MPPGAHTPKEESRALANVGDTALGRRVEPRVKAHGGLSGFRLFATGSDALALRVQMAEHEVTIELSPEAKEMLVEKGYDPAMGARPLRRAIQRLIEDPLADFVLGRSLAPGSTIVVKRRSEEEVDIEVIPPVGEPEPAKVGATAEAGGDGDGEEAASE